ncbi:hypothetical protein K505DRAFT_356446 [Melanomma pulvis-pyrius CBS 109.77]|uniref:Xylanolytic transcriptional activator regulatory domain-containing protein n=1 Tax=Melanomma pulvis-pyrius CBS 109.77 TaxID=1314802 RepID=A0A6A6XT96_9PLEO|nr:hypothetical protein K505DRAFT_356446 [Melanomma pulvis-pyrius CBS 109.77]
MSKTQALAHIIPSLYLTINVDPAPQSSLTDTFGNDIADVSFLNLGANAFFDLDLLDGGMFDNLFPTGRDDISTDIAISESPYQQSISPEITATSRSYAEDTNTNLPCGMSLLQISPLDAHRLQILQFLNESNQDSWQWNQWLGVSNMARFLRSYFKSFHQHTPLLHLPFWNIASTSTRLVFSMILMGAMYSGDLKSYGSEARQLCQMAQTFAWASDLSLQAGGPAELDTIQAVYIATLLDTFYFPAKRHRPPVNTRRLINEARSAGVFDSVNPSNEPWKMKWDEWSAQEMRIRTAFILYLFDAIRAVLFDQRPELHLYELRLPLPCDENIFAVNSKDNWHELYANSQNPTRVDYPIVLSLFLCNHPVEMPLHFSVMGAFVVLHGILLHIWEQKTIHVQIDCSKISNEVEQNVRKHLVNIQSQVVDNALRLWRKHWVVTLSRPGSMASEGLYRDRALAYWFLGNIMNRNRSMGGMGNWTLRILQLLRRLTTLVDSGQLDVASDNVTGVAGENIDPHLGDIQESADESADVEGVDTIILDCMMRKDRPSGD